MMNKQVELKVGICIAYDWEMLKYALPIIYDDVDKICLSLDKNRCSWSGNVFEFDDNAFYSYVRDFDVNNKIIIYEDNFSIDPLNPMKGEVFQRNKMGEVLGEGGWHIQIDVDEYFYDIKYFAKFLRSNYDKFKAKAVNICLPVYIIFKQVEEGFFVIGGNTEWFTVATNKPVYEYGRRNGHFNYQLNSPLFHQSWARPEDEIKQKIMNWGHKNDFDVVSFFDKWRSLGIATYQQWLNFHPIDGKVWSRLHFIKAKSIDELIQRKEDFANLHNHSKFDLMVSNSRLLSKLFQIIGLK